MIFKNIFHFRETGIPTSTRPQESGMAQVANSNRSGDFEQSVKRATRSSALTLSAVYRAVELRAKTMGMLLMQYQYKSKVGGNFVQSDDRYSRLINYLLQVRPNDLMKASELFEQIEVNRLLKGNAYVYIERSLDTGEPSALWLAIDGSYIEGEHKYSLTLQRTNGTGAFIVPAEDVIHISNTFKRPGSTIIGISTLDFACDCLTLSLTQNDLALRDASKGGRMKLLVSEEKKDIGLKGRLNRDEVSRNTKKIEQELYSSDVTFISNMLDAKIVSMNAEQMQLLQQRGFGIPEVARFFGVPKSLLMDDSNSSYKTPEAATQEFLLRTIAPSIRNIEDEFNAKLLSFSDFGKRRYHLCERPLLRLNQKSQAAIDKIQLETGIATVNELRAQYDRSAVENGDLHYISTNLAELGSKKLSGETAQSVNPPTITTSEPTEEPVKP